jgi:hypothetical protein
LVVIREGDVWVLIAAFHEDTKVPVVASLPYIPDVYYLNKVSTGPATATAVVVNDKELEELGLDGVVQFSQ